MPDLLDTLTTTGGAANSAALMEGLGRILEDEALGFTWEADHIVLGEQRPIAIYRNPANGIVIRERGDDTPDDDMFIVLRDVSAVRALIAALTAEIGGGG